MVYTYEYYLLELPHINKLPPHSYTNLPPLAAQLLHHFTPSEQITPSLLHHFTPWKPNSYINKSTLNKLPPHSHTNLPLLAAQLLHHFNPLDKYPLNKSKKQPVPKYCMKRAKENLDIVHTNVLRKISPEAVDGNCYVIGFVDSFSNFSKVYFIKTRDEVLDNFKQFCADDGKPGTLVYDGGGENISNEFKCYCRNQ